MEYFASSDIPAVLEYTKNFYFLDDNEFSIIEKDSIKFFDKNLNAIAKNYKTIDLNYSSSTKNEYAHFMLKEIFEQPKAIIDTIDKYILSEDKNKQCVHFQESVAQKHYATNLIPSSLFNFSNCNLTKYDLINIKQIYIVACGTAMHVGLASKNIIEKLCKIPTFVEIASEFRYQDPIINENTLCLFISQSGETADTIAALKLAKQKGCKTIAITNVIGSSITREAQFSFYTYAGLEVSVASTKAYSCQIALIYCFAIHIAEILETTNFKILEELKEELFNLPEKIQTILQKQEEIKNIAKQCYLQKDLFFLGRGIDYAVSLEGSLKLKEVSYIHSEAYASGELKHGPIALIEDGIYVVGILTDSELTLKTISNLQEVISRGAKTFVITNTKLPDNNFDFIFTVPKTNTFLSPILSVVPLQLFAYYIAKEKGLDVDKPRNLAKCVTVE